VRRQDFSFDLPEELIAQSPLPERSASRLLVLDGATGAISDRVMGDLPSYLRDGDLLVFNDTRVVAARIVGSKPSGGRVEIFLERVVAALAGAVRGQAIGWADPAATGASPSDGEPAREELRGRAEGQALVQLRASKPIREGLEITTPGGIVRVVGREDELWRVEVPGPGNALEFFEAWGEVPLPPYIHRSADASDRERYQSIFAREKGAVAAPTASLHLDAPLVAKLEDMGVGRAFVTLHVGAGTFQPLRTDDLDAHKMHAERVSVSAETWDAIRRTREAGGRVIAVGTTVVRALESAALQGTGFLESPASLMELAGARESTESPAAPAAHRAGAEMESASADTTGPYGEHESATAPEVVRGAAAAPAIETELLGARESAAVPRVSSAADGVAAALASETEFRDAHESAAVRDVSATPRGAISFASGDAPRAHVATGTTWFSETRLFIRPGFQFQVVDAMVTNFHLPESTLLMLVSAFAGREHVLGAYAHAVRERYRFFSYGDAMLVMPTYPRPTSGQTTRATDAQAQASAPGQGPS